MQEKIKSFCDQGLEISIENLIKFDLTAKSLEAGMQKILKEGNMQISGTEKKLPNLLKKLHCTIQ